MTGYIEKTLHCPVSVWEYNAIRKFPPVISGNYTLKAVAIDGRECVFAKPSPDVNLSALRKQQKQLEKLTGKICVLYLTKINAYAKGRLIEEGIPFVVEGKQIYLPFLGVSLSDEDERVFKPCGQISFLTQKLLLISIYEKWKDVSVSEAAGKLCVAKTSITRCYDEIEALELPYIRKKSRARLFSVKEDLKGMWEELREILRNPVLQQFPLKDDLKEPGILSGLSALGYYSMLGDNPYPVYAVYKKDIVRTLTDHTNMCPADDIPGCVVQEVGYIINFRNEQVIDPFSVVLMLTESEKDDPRVLKAADEMLEETVWSRD